MNGLQKGRVIQADFGGISRHQTIQSLVVTLWHLDFIVSHWKVLIRGL